MILQKEPSFIELLGYEDKVEALRKLLAYADKKVDYEIRSFKKSKPWFVEKHGQEAFDDHLADLKEQRVKTALLLRENLSTYSGLLDTVSHHFQDYYYKNEVVYPDRELIAWHQEPEHVIRPYQLDAFEKLVSIKHGGVEIGTGLGKSLIIELLAKHYGLKTMVLTPSVSIAYQLYEDFVKYFGRRKVGAFFDGKKDYYKKFVIAVAASVTRVEEGSEAWEELATTKVFIADESHLCPAVTLAHICFGIVKDAPYRFFFSGTQLRNDGLDMLLEGIVGRIVLKMTVKEGVDQGYLAKPFFRMIKTVSNDSYNSQDPNRMTRKHLYYNPTVNRIAASLINRAVRTMNHQVLVLIEEVEQFGRILNHLQVPAQFAHGPLTKENMKDVPEVYRKCDPNALVEAFDRREFPVLIGTSCISTGTNIRANETTVYLQGGTSEIQVRQGPIGRSTRLFGTKKSCFIFDFDVENVEITHRHAEARTALYNETYGPVENIWLK